MGDLKDWGLYISGTERKVICSCSRESHGIHQYLLPFHKTKRDLLCYYNTCILAGNLKTADATQDHSFLLQLKDNLVSHLHTKFYCLGLLFGEGENYREADWIRRLLTAILPNDIVLVPGSDFSDNFLGLKELISTSDSAAYYYIPDGVFIKKLE